MYTVVAVKLEEVLPLRQQVLRCGAPLDQCRSDCDKDNLPCYHFAIKDQKSKECIAVASFYQQDNKEIADAPSGSWRLRGMAVAPNLQGSGIGSILLNECLDVLEDENIPAVWCKIRDKALSFYKRKSFEIRGEVYEVHNIGFHYDMIKFLRGSSG